MSAIAIRIRDALAAGVNTEALDLARQAIGAEPAAPEFAYLGALACVRMGAIGEAERWLRPVDFAKLPDTPLAADLWSLAGRIAKERYAAVKMKSEANARDYARVALASYRRAFDISGSPYPAVNAATMAKLAGDADLSRTLAQLALAVPRPTADHWYHATLGEARLLLGELDDARAHYAQARRLAGDQFGDIASMRRQLRLLGGADAEAMLAAVPAPSVVAFSGHMIDRPDRAAPRFPARLEPEIARALRDKLSLLGPSIGYAQAACGGDILFLEALQDAGMQTHVVLPFDKRDFIHESVDFAGPEWITRFERVLARATHVLLATEEPFLGDEVLFEHAANLVQGLAFWRARELASQPLLLTVRDPQTDERIGGTAATARTWVRKGGRIDTIDLARLRDEEPAPGDVLAPAPTSPKPLTPRCLESLLFADICGFSKMPEQYTPHFVEMFLGTCKRILDSLEHPCVDANTRGDGLFLVFDLPSHAAEFALRLQETANTFDWSTWGLASDTGVRMGLHTGPVFRTYDAVMSKTTFFGAHVNRAARLEPIVQPGHILVTEMFAASLAAESDQRFDCDYVGTLPLAKHYGDARLYRLGRANGA